MFTEIWEAVAPGVFEAAGTLLMLVLTWASMTLKAKWGIEIEARHREALHSAIMSGVARAMEGGLTREMAIEAAVAYARQSVPDAIRYLTAPDGILFDLARAKLQQLVGGR